MSAIVTKRCIPQTTHRTSLDSHRRGRLRAALARAWQRLIQTRVNRAALFAGQEAATGLHLAMLQGRDRPHLERD